MNIKILRNKTNAVIAIIVIVLIAALVIFYTEKTASKNANSPKTVITYSVTKETTTVFDELIEYGKNNNIEIAYNNNYEFGVLVESIGGIKSGDDGKYWQYYVNNKLGDVASDKKTISGNDIVEWRFEKVPF